MEEVYTCDCGGQSWTIFGSRIRCRKCGNEYDVYLSASSFNGDKARFVIPSEPMPDEEARP